jgi:hypothetical protein
VLDAASTMGFDGKPTGTVTAYTADVARELDLPPADQYTASRDELDHPSTRVVQAAGAIPPTFVLRTVLC